MQSKLLHCQALKPSIVWFNDFFKLIFRKDQNLQSEYIAVLTVATLFRDDIRSKWCLPYSHFCLYF